MTRKWSIKSKTSFFTHKPFWNSTVKKVISKSLTLIVPSKKFKKNKKTESECIFKINEENFSQPTKDSQIVSHLEEMSTDDATEIKKNLKKSSTILHQSAIECQVKKEKKYIFNFVKVCLDNIFKNKNCLEESSLVYETNENIIPIKVERDNEENFKDYFEYISELNDYTSSKISTKIKKSPLILSSNVNIYQDYYVNYNEHIKNINIKFNSTENLIFIDYSLERLSQIKVEHLEDKISNEYFTEITEVKNESSSDNQIRSLSFSIDNLFHGINKNSLYSSKNEYVIYLPINKSIIYDSISKNEIEGLPHRNIKIEEIKNMFNVPINLDFNENTEQFHSIYNNGESNFPQFLFKNLKSDSFFIKYIHGITNSPTMKNSLSTTHFGRLSSIKVISSDEKNSTTLLATKSSIEDLIFQKNNSSLIYEPFSTSSITSCPSFYIKDNDFYLLDTLRLKNSLLELREQIQKLSILEEKLTSYYEFLLNQQSSV